jgi:membrane protein implicated in regulation of membrane protease activity
MLDLLFAWGPWTWIVAGVILTGLELVAPGAFLIWLGIAALLTGLVLFLLPLGWELTLLVFALLAVASVFVGRWVTRDKNRGSSGEPLLNRRGDALVGRIVVLEGPIEQGRGRVRIDDTVWRVEGPDLPAGSRVRVDGVDGALLRVAEAR